MNVRFVTQKIHAMLDYPVAIQPDGDAVSVGPRRIYTAGTMAIRGNRRGGVHLDIAY